MPSIIIKRPHSDPKIIEVTSRNIPDFYKELNLLAVYESIGTGLLLIIQSLTQFDEPNVFFEDKGISGTVYVIRSTKDRIIDVKETDMEYFINNVKFVDSSEEWG